MTDIGVTGGGNGRHMVYHAGRTDHTIDGGDMVEHIIETVERRAAELAAAAPVPEKVAAE